MSEDEGVGPYGFRVGSPDPRSLTGYDLVHHVIRRWLECVNNQEFSVCEVLFAEQKTALYTYEDYDGTDESMPEPSLEVKVQPHAFISHVQRENVGMTVEALESGCLYNGMRADSGEDGCVPLQGNLLKLYRWLD